MARSIARLVSLSILFTFSFCDHRGAVGSLPDGPGSATSDPGHGTGTLQVEATIRAIGLVNNAQSSDQFNTEFEVTVAKEKIPVSEAEVAIGSSIGIVTLSPALGKGEYVASQTGYFRTYTLDIVAGTDDVKGVRLTGPEPYTITSPPEDFTHPPGEALTVAWQPSGADEATIETTQMPPVVIQDTGEYSIAGNFLRGNPAKASEDWIRVYRSSILSISGGAPLSKLIIHVRNQTDFIIDRQ